jgi:hypothetical protein
MSARIDPKTAESLVDLHLKQRSDDLNCRVSMLLWSAAAEFTRTTGEHEFAFMDRVMRLYVGAMFGLDPSAAHSYLKALATRADTSMEPHFREAAETMRAVAFKMLLDALKLAAAQPGGSA